MTSPVPSASPGADARRAATLPAGVRRRLWSTQPPPIRFARHAAVAASALGATEVAVAVVEAVRGGPLSSRLWSGVLPGLALLLAAALLTVAMRVVLVAATPPQHPAEDGAEVNVDGQAPLAVAASFAWFGLALGLGLVLAPTAAPARPPGPSAPLRGFTDLVARFGAVVHDPLPDLMALVSTTRTLVAVTAPILLLATGFLLLAAYTARADHGLGRAPRWVLVVRAALGGTASALLHHVRALHRARSALLPHLTDYWRHGGPGSEGSALGREWEGLWDCWRCYAWLRQLGTAFAVIFAAATVRTVSRSGWAPDLWPILLFGLITAAIAQALARLLRAAVREAPPTPVGRESWLDSRDRILAIADMHGDARNFLLVWCIVQSVLGLALVSVLGYGAVQAVTSGEPLGPDQVAAFRRDYVDTVRPYAAGALSVLTVGALAFVLNAHKKLWVLRADVELRTRASWQQD